MQLNDEDFNLFKDKIYKESGIHFSAVNRSILESRIRERLRHNNLTSATEYFAVINKDPGELKLLLDCVTTNLTSFFRNEVHFEALRKIVLPEIVNRKVPQNRKKLKVWSAGCSTGEEAYTIAITALENIPNPNSWQIEILASDISLKSLLVAKEGYYSHDKMTNMKKEYLDKYFDDTGNGYTAKDSIKSLIRFDYHNLKFDNGERDIDIIFCRNVIIYFDRVAQIDVISRFSECANEDSYLFIGHSESLFGMNTAYKFHQLGDACVYRKK